MGQRAASETASEVAFKITFGYSSDVHGIERTGGWRALAANKARRVQLAMSAGIVALGLQLLLLVGVLDGTPTWVQIIVFAIYALLVAVVLVMAVLNVKEQRTRRER
jgi:peptidoglycan/LPS O-acetylase OafA/YrhL